MSPRLPRRLTTLLLATLLLVPSTLVLTATPSTSPVVTSAIDRQVTLQPGQDYVVSFNASTLTLTPASTMPDTTGLSASVITAIAKAPIWIQRDLTRQFKTLPDPQPYADLLINCSIQYADEIAFSLACSPEGKIFSPDLLFENAKTLYDADKYLQYADIVDYNDGMGNYYSTIQYRVLDNGTSETFQIPPQIYYWYVVHPKLTRAELDATYGPLWRTYLFWHNDLGYPLLKEKLAGIQYLWDNCSYFEGSQRLWTPSIQAHPTAIEAIGYWVGKTVPNQAYGDRPGKPSIVAHEHNGWCGELQAIAVAAQRAALIPSLPACNIGEDHVWREFYERGWHENDNWWTDGGGAVNEPDIYGYGWGKNMSAILGWRGDDTILDDTSMYIHDADRITVSFKVKDVHGQPIDGARVLVLLTGPKDITYYKNLVWGKIQQMWDRLPPALKGKLLTGLFTRLKDRFDDIPDSVQGASITTWNYTNLDGYCSFQLGKNIEYVFLIQAGHLGLSWQLSRHAALRSLKTHVDAQFTVLFPEVLHRPVQMINQSMPPGDCTLRVSFSSMAYQRQTNVWTGGIGSVEGPGKVDCFVVDAKNLAKYRRGLPFIGHRVGLDAQGSAEVSCPTQDWFVVFQNPGRVSTVVVNCSLQAQVVSVTDHVQIVYPNSSLFIHPIVNVGQSLIISGIATGPLSLTIGNASVALTPEDGWWSYLWDTSGTTPGIDVQVVGHCGDATDSTTIRVQDMTPPEINIVYPWENEVITRGPFLIYGDCVDNGVIDHVQVRVDNATWQIANGTSQWIVDWDGGTLSLGDHVIEAQAFDWSGLISTTTSTFAINESGHSWGPQINSLTLLPENLSNLSNVILWVNVSQGSPYQTSWVKLHSILIGKESVQDLYRYGDFPVQTRHEEDPLRNESNLPVWGCELGQFPAETTVIYWIVARDSAGNTAASEPRTFTIEG